MAFATYDVNQIAVIVGGVPLEGFADGTRVTVEFDEEQFTKVTGSDGLTTRSKSNNYAGSVSITLQQSSRSNDYLAGLWNADRFNNSGVVPILIKDNSGRTLWAAEHAWVQQMPSQEFGKALSDREWVLDTDKLSGIAGGNQPLI
ncbi:MAG: DUF3277 family protein [Methyloprofundus sp.]|nr:DUF3277 family protein [Methyloprofundus sp.]